MQREWVLVFMSQRTWAMCPMCVVCVGKRESASSSQEIVSSQWSSVQFAWCRVWWVVGWGGVGLLECYVLSSPECSLAESAGLETTQPTLTDTDTDTGKQGLLSLHGTYPSDPEVKLWSVSFLGRLSFESEVKSWNRDISRIRTASDNVSYAACCRLFEVKHTKVSKCTISNSAVSEQMFWMF